MTTQANFGKTSKAAIGNPDPTETRPFMISRIASKNRTKEQSVILRKDNQMQYQNRLIKKPWYVSFRSARSRCNDKNDPAYPRYGGKGIKFLLTREDMIFLWNRDCADKMEKPTIDRIKSNKDYVRSNCQFLEHYENSVKEKNIPPVAMILPSGQRIVFKNASEAGRYLKNKTAKYLISQCLRGKAKTALGFKWERV